MVAIIDARRYVEGANKDKGNQMTEIHPVKPFSPANEGISRSDCIAAKSYVDLLEWRLDEIEKDLKSGREYMAKLKTILTGAS